MTTAAEMLRRWRALDIIQITGEAIEQTEAEAIRLNQAQLFLRSERPDGVKLEPYKSRAYAEKKHARNPAPGLFAPDAYDTGQMFRAMFVEVKGDRVVFDSTSPHATSMEARENGKPIFGLTIQSKETYKETYMPLVQIRIKELTGTI